jgi:sortase A
MIIRVQWRRNRESRRKKLLRWAARFFFAAGCVALTLCAVWYGQARVYQQAALAKAGIPPQKPIQAKVPQPIRTEPVLEIDIPRIGLSVAVVEGVSARNIRVAVGHVPGTALPGGEGNVAIAGHRDTFFRSLRFIQRGDAIRLVTQSATYDYAVESTRITDAHDASPLRNSGGPLLTLITCYPFYFVGPAPKRFIVRAVRTGQAIRLHSEGRGGDHPASDQASYDTTKLQPVR